MLGLLVGASALAATAVAVAPSSAQAQAISDARRMRVAQRLERSTVRVHSGRSKGSGFVAGPQRWVLTNAHVVRTPRVAVRFSSGQTRRGVVIAVHRRHDLAVVKVKGKVPVPPIPLADSDDVRVGQTVLAFGSPFGLDGTLTQGIVSARRDWRGIEDVIQTDASINPGSSGGPLVDARGRVVGVSTAILSRGGGNHGIAFAVPSNTVRELLAHARREGASAKADLTRGRGDGCDCRCPRPRCR